MKHGIHIRPSLVRCAREGFYFCKDCRHVVQRLEDELLPAGRCAECRSPRIHWHPPALTDEHRTSAGRIEFLTRRPGRQDAD